MRASHERHELDGSFRLFRLVAHCSAGPGKLDAWTGRREDARQHLAYCDGDVPQDRRAALVS